VAFFIFRIFVKIEQNEEYILKHADLCEIAKKWLVRTNSQGGHGCGVALSECRSGWGGEIPDAIGFRAVYEMTETVVVEVKISRSDFLVDAKKPHRADGSGMGMFRYYMCPEGLIQPDELPVRWGLLWVNSRGHVKPMAGPVFLSNNSGNFNEVSKPWKHAHDTAKEMWLMTRVMARINDPDKMKKSINNAMKEASHYKAVCERQNERIKELEERVFRNGVRNLL
jgi:hypothetical protein